MPTTTTRRASLLGLVSPVIIAIGQYFNCEESFDHPAAPRSGLAA